MREQQIAVIRGEYHNRVLVELQFAQLGHQFPERTIITRAQGHVALIHLADLWRILHVGAQRQFGRVI